MTIIDKEQIRRDLQEDYKNLTDDLESMKLDLIKLGTTVSDDEGQRAKEYKTLQFNASLVQQNLNLVKRLIIHAEYCDWYIKENEKCHAAKDALISQLRKDVQPFITGKETADNITTFTKYLSKFGWVVVFAGAFFSCILYMFGKIKLVWS